MSLHAKRHFSRRKTHINKSTPIITSNERGKKQQMNIKSIAMQTLTPYLPYIAALVGIIMIAVRKSIRKGVADRAERRGKPIMMQAMSGEISQLEAESRLLAIARGTMWIFALDTFLLWFGMLLICVGIYLLRDVLFTQLLPIVDFNTALTPGAICRAIFGAFGILLAATILGFICGGIVAAIFHIDNMAIGGALAGIVGLFASQHPMFQNLKLPLLCGSAHTLSFF